MAGKKKTIFGTVHEYLFDPDVYECSACEYEAKTGRRMLSRKVVKEPVPMTYVNLI